MSHPELLKKVPKLGVQGAKPPAGVAGHVAIKRIGPAKLPFPSFTRRLRRRVKEGKEQQGRPLQPPIGAGRPCEPRRKGDVTFSSTQHKACRDDFTFVDLGDHSWHIYDWSSPNNSCN